MKVSITFETTALLPSDAPLSWDLPYLNLVVRGDTIDSPSSLLDKLKAIEQLLGRTPSPKWAPRLIDLDILTWNDEVYSSEELKIPHPELKNRPFLLNLMASLKNGIDQVISMEGPQRTFSSSLQLVGVVNVTPDSFSDGGSFLQTEKALERIHQLAEEGAAVIDIGACSSAPDAPPLSPEEEWSRLEPVLKRLSFGAARPLLSLDSSSIQVIQKALQITPFDWINDVSGWSDPRLWCLLAEIACKIVLMHSLGTPPSRNKTIPLDQDPIQYLLKWGKEKIDAFTAFGIPKERIIFDPGIGFGNTPLQALSILRNIGRLKELGSEILVGHSRKSFFNPFTSTPYRERDLETIGISNELAKRGVDYLRVHNIGAHHRTLSAGALLDG